MLVPAVGNQNSHKVSDFRGEGRYPPVATGI
jgi:hypothetical protein